MHLSETTLPRTSGKDSGPEYESADADLAGSETGHSQPLPAVRLIRGHPERAAKGRQKRSHRRSQWPEHPLHRLATGSGRF